MNEYCVKRKLLREAFFAGMTKAELIHHLKRPITVSSTDVNGRTLLHRAIMYIRNANRRLQICDYLLNHGAKINARDKYGNTPLHCFCQWPLAEENRELLSLLINRGAEINATNAELFTPLHEAIKSEYAKTAEELLKFGANSNALTEKRESPLSLTIRVSGDEEMMKLLIRYHADVNDYAAVSACVSTKKIYLLRLLMECGTDLRKCHREKEDMDDYLDAYDLLNKAIENSDTNMVECLLENGIELDQYLFFCILAFAVSLFLVQFNPSVRFEYRKRLEVIRVIVKHLVILLITDPGLVNESALRLAEESFDRRKLENYKHQLKLIIETRVTDNSSITYFDLLMKKGKELLRCCNEIVERVLSTERIPEALFPDFAEKLRRNYRRGLIEKKYRERVKQSLFLIFQPRLSFDLICLICDYLETIDLTAFRLSIRYDG